MAGPATLETNTDNIQLDEASKRELEQFVQNEQRTIELHQTVHEFTDLCFEKCILSNGPSKAFNRSTMDKSEETCMVNCVSRFFDASAVVYKKLSESAAKTLGH